MGARLGQHFLFDPSILQRIADATGLTAREVALEIGPGKGTLTRVLSSRAGSVVAIEKDRRLAAGLRREFEGTRVTIVEGDALGVPWPRADVVAGNIPYAITSPLIERALTPPLPRCIVFLVQKEVADRLAASPGGKSYGALTAGVGLVATAERLFSVKAGAFRPPPRVDSAVVRLTPRKTPLGSDHDTRQARALIRAAFQRRRQQLQRTLREAFGLSQTGAHAALKEAGFLPETRPEELGPAEFIALARAMPPA